MPHGRRHGQDENRGSAAANRRRRGLSLRDRLVAYLPRYAPYAAHPAPLMNLRNGVPSAGPLMERATGFSAKRPLPDGAARLLPVPSAVSSPRLWGEGRGDGQQQSLKQASAPRLLPAEGRGEGIGHVALFADTFNTYFEPENLHAAVAVLTRLGYRVTVLSPGKGERALCCGRTYLSAGLVDQARAEARRVLAAAAPILAQGGTVVGLVSCLSPCATSSAPCCLGQTARLASRSQLLEEFLAAEAAGHVDPSPPAGPPSFCTATAIEGVWCDAGHPDGLGTGRGSGRKDRQSSCCGMAGIRLWRGYASGLGSAGELSLLPAVRKAAPDALIVADGFSCRHQIHDGTGRTALHVSRLLCDAMARVPLGAPAQRQPVPAAGAAGRSSICGSSYLMRGVLHESKVRVQNIGRRGIATLASAAWQTWPFALLALEPADKQPPAP
jgi:Fe-S oxidoreductase